MYDFSLTGKRGKRVTKPKNTLDTEPVDLHRGAVKLRLEPAKYPQFCKGQGEGRGRGKALRFCEHSTYISLVLYEKL